jgi:homoserine kinase type II
MAAKTELSEHELAQIMTNYTLGKYIESEPFTNGNVQTNIRIQTTNGQFVFRYYENRTENSVLFETELLRYLKGNNYPCPEPIKNRNGDFVNIYNSKPYVVFEYVEGHHVQEPNEIQKKQLIQKAAELHTITKDYQPIHKESRWNYGVGFCKEQAQKASVRTNSLNSIKKLIWLENGLHELNLPQSLPKGICHADFHFSNVIFNNGEFSALLDFDDANYTYLLFDLVGLIESWAWRYDKDEIINFKEAKKIVLEYTKHRPLKTVEKEHLFDVYKLCIFIDCVWFFERGEIEDFYEKRKIDYLDHIGRKKFYEELFS